MQKQNAATHLWLSRSPLSLSINIENSTQKKIVAQKTHLVFQCPAETVHRHAAVLRCYFKQTEWDLFSD